MPNVISLCLVLSASLPSHLFFKDSALCSCNIRDEGALHALGESVNRLCVTVVNKSESVSSVSLECPVLTQKSDSPLSVGSVHRGGQCGEIPKISFPEASTNKRQKERLAGDIVSVFLHACVPFFLLPWGCAYSGPPRLLLLRPPGPSSMSSSVLLHTSQSHLCINVP